MPNLPTLTVAHEVRAIAQELIREHHAHLFEANLLYVFTDQRRKRCDRVRLGSAAKMNAMLRFLASGMDSVEDGPDFLILIDSNEWAGLGPQARKAVVDHELCVPAETVVSGPRVDASMARWYAGQMVEVRTASGHFLAATPNHPVLTSRGWVPLEFLNERDYVLSSGDPKRVAQAVDPHEYQMPSVIQQIASSDRVRLGFVPESAQHLDAYVPDSQIDVVATDRRLMHRGVATAVKHVGQFLLGGRDAVLMGVPRGSHPLECGFGMSSASPRGIGLLHVEAGEHSFFRSLETDLLGLRAIPDHDAIFSQDSLDNTPAHGQRRRYRENGLFSRMTSDHVSDIDWNATAGRLATQPVGVLERPEFDSEIAQRATDCRHADAEGFAQYMQSRPGSVALDKVVSVRRRPFQGHVFNLQTRYGWYSANGIIVHNCHCASFVKDTSEKPAVWRRVAPNVLRDDDHEWRWGLRGHDLEEFADVLKRYGWWRADPQEQAFREMAIQLVMPQNGAAKREVAKT